MLYEIMLESWEGIALMVFFGALILAPVVIVLADTYKKMKE
jgi:hypothetical protein